jgi:hypothetical protein
MQPDDPIVPTFDPVKDEIERCVTREQCSKRRFVDVLAVGERGEQSDVGWNAAGCGGNVLKTDLSDRCVRICLRDDHNQGG